MVLALLMGQKLESSTGKGLFCSLVGMLWGTAGQQLICYFIQATPILCAFKACVASGAWQGWHRGCAIYKNLSGQAHSLPVTNAAHKTQEPNIVCKADNRPWSSKARHQVTLLRVSQILRVPCRSMAKESIGNTCMHSINLQFLFLILLLVNSHNLVFLI